MAYRGDLALRLTGTLLLLPATLATLPGEADGLRQ